MALEREEPAPEDRREEELESETLGRESRELAERDQSSSGAPAGGHAIRDLFSTDEIFQRIVATADEEITRSARLLFFSGLAAGFSIGLSFIARSAVTGLGESEWFRLLGNLFYPLGFLLIVMGRYQLFTENTLPPVLLVLTRIASVPVLLRIWAIVLVANVIGTILTAFVLAHTGVFTTEAASAAREFGEHALEISATDLFWKGVFAGWIVASMVWLTHAVRDSTARFLIVFSLMFLVPTAELFHCIIGVCEVSYLYFQSIAPLWPCVRFVGVVLAGNTVGGVLLVALLNYSQTRDSRFPQRNTGELRLSWRDFLFGLHVGSPNFEAKRDGE